MKNTDYPDDITCEMGVSYRRMKQKLNYRDKNLLELPITKEEIDDQFTKYTSCLTEGRALALSWN